MYNKKARQGCSPSWGVFALLSVTFMYIGGVNGYQCANVSILAYLVYIYVNVYIYILIQALRKVKSPTSCIESRTGNDVTRCNMRKHPSKFSPQYDYF